MRSIKRVYMQADLPHRDPEDSDKWFVRNSDGETGV